MPDPPSMRTQTSPPPPARNVQFLFLASHGLLSPISAIRWGAHRLKRTQAAAFSKEQNDLINHIYINAKVLSKIFGSMLLLARNEDQTYTMQPERVSLHEFLKSQAKDWEEVSGRKARIVCDDHVTLSIDREMLETIFEDLFAVFSEAGPSKQGVKIEVQALAGRVQVAFFSPLELPFLQSVQTLDRKAEVRPVVGGTPGLLLSLTQSLIGFLDGGLEMQEAGNNVYKIVATLPAGRRGIEN